MHPQLTTKESDSNMRVYTKVNCMEFILAMSMKLVPEFECHFWFIVIIEKVWHKSSYIDDSECGKLRVEDH